MMSGSLRTVSSICQTGVTWSKQVGNHLGTDGSGYDDSEIWLGIVGSGASTSVTVTLSGSADYGAAADICEYSGVATSSSLDQTSTATGSSTSTSTGTTATTTVPNELWIGSIAAADGTGHTQSSATNSFTLLDGAVLASYVSEAYLEKIVTSTATAYSGTTCSGSVNGWFGCIATFKAVSKTTPTVPAPTLSIPTSTTVGTSETLSVTVSGSGGTPTGTATFEVNINGGGYNVIGSAVTLSSGSASRLMFLNCY